MNEKLSTEQKRIAIGVAILFTAGTTYLAINISLVALWIVGIAGVIAYILWYTTYLKNPVNPAVILPLFLVTVAGFAFHAIEESLGHYGPAVGRIFNFPWTDQVFVITILILLGVLCLVSIGLYYRVPVAGFIAIVFLTTRIAEVGLFIFPLIRPAIQPETASPVTQMVSGVLVQNMPNYYTATVNMYYFPGMYTVLLPLIPAVFALYRLWKSRVGKNHRTA